MALLDGAGELRERDDRDLEVAREHLERTRDLRDLLDAVLDRHAARHQLQVVDDHQAELGLLHLQAASFERISIIVIEPVSST